jgi:hypothetical protein
VIDRPDLSLTAVAAVAAEAARCDGLRVTLAGVGDPLQHGAAAEIIRLFGRVHALHVETDLIDLPDETLAALVESNVDVVTVHLPAMRPQTYAKVMGVDAMARVLTNVERLLRARQAAGCGVPLIVPTLTKTHDNFDEIEQWYDTWLRALGSATIVGPTTFCGRIADVGVADMAPAVRRPCRRIEDQMVLLSDGRFVACEQDATGTSRSAVPASTRSPTPGGRPRHSARRTVTRPCRKRAAAARSGTVHETAYERPRRHPRPWGQQGFGEQAPAAALRPAGH